MSTILKGALNHAHREGKCASDDAWRTVRAFREADAARLRYLSDDESRRLTNACQDDFRALATGALLTGCRYGELAAMTVDDFKPDAGTLRVRASKGGKPRHVVLTQEGCDSDRAPARDDRRRPLPPVAAHPQPAGDPNEAGPPEASRRAAAAAEASG